MIRYFAFYFFIVFTLSSACTKEKRCSPQSVEINGHCECVDGFKGYKCELLDSCLVNPIECMNEGVCNSGRCLCLRLYEGESCEYFIPFSVIGEYNVTAFKGQGDQNHVWNRAITSLKIDEIIEQPDDFWGKGSCFHTVTGGQQGYSANVRVVEAEVKQCAHCGDTLLFEFYGFYTLNNGNGVSFLYNMRFSNQKLKADGYNYLLDPTPSGKYRYDTLDMQSSWFEAVKL